MSLRKSRNPLLACSALVLVLLVPPLVTTTTADSFTYGFDVIRNGSFEDGVSQLGLPLEWGNWTKHSCVPFGHCTKTAEITVNDTRAAEGRWSARITLGQVPLGFASLWHRFPSNTRFSNLTDAVGDLDLWFYLEPKYDGMGEFAVKVYAQNAQELDYVFDPDPQLSWPNQTFSDGRPYVKSILLGDLTGTSPQYPPGQWHRFSFRNLKADWQAPMRLQNGTLLPGFSLDENMSLLEIGAFAFQDVSTSAYYSIIVWTDDVKVFLDTKSSGLDTIPPIWPFGSTLTFSNLTPTGVDLNWTPAEDNFGVASYRIFANDSLLVALPAGVHYSSFSGLAPESVYIFKVEAGDVAGNWSTDGPETIVETTPVTVRTPEVFVWSDTCGSPDITVLNTSCGLLQVDDAISVEVKVQNAPVFNAYDFSLYYDPGFLEVVSVDVSTSTVFNNPFVAKQNIDIPGVTRLAVTALGGVFSGGDGTLAHFSFRIRGLGVSPLTLAAGMRVPSSFANSFTLIALGASLIDITTSDGYFTNVADRQGPVASFNFTPMEIEADQSVTFSASASYDPDNDIGGTGISEYFWDFGDGGVARTGSPATAHVFRGAGSGPGFVGNFSVLLKVTDSNDGFQGMKTMRVEIRPRSLRDVRVLSLTVFPSTLGQGDNATVEVLVRNEGTQSEVFTLTAQVGPPTLIFGIVANQSISSHETQSFTFALNTEALEVAVYVVNATVTIDQDDRPENNYATTVIVVQRPPRNHDVSVEFVDVYPQVAVSGQFVGIQVAVKNSGVADETVDLTVYYDSTVIDVLTGLLVRRGVFQEYFQIIWDTSSVPAGDHTISASVFLGSDEDLSNNDFTDGTVRILPPPVLTLTPESGGLATMVNVHGSGFPSQQSGYGSISPILVSFDDMFLGYTVARGSHFDFTFNVPHSEPGFHTVKVLDAARGIRAAATFEVLDTPPILPSHLTLTMDTGAIYFQGERADIFVLASLGGSPVEPGDVDVRVVLVRPNGSRLGLDTQRIGPGLYKASFTIPRTQALGTYAVIAEAHHIDGVDATSLGEFQVKPAWIETEPGRTATIAAAFAGVIAVAAFTVRGGLRGRGRVGDTEPVLAKPGNTHDIVFSGASTCRPTNWRLGWFPWTRMVEG